MTAGPSSGKTTVARNMTEGLRAAGLSVIVLTHYKRDADVLGGRTVYSALMYVSLNHSYMISLGATGLSFVSQSIVSLWAFSREGAISRTASLLTRLSPVFAACTFCP